MDTSEGGETVNRLGKLHEIEQTIDQCRARCVAENMPFHADALAAALGISYETLIRYADGKGTSANTAALLRAAVQECTASVIACALSADPKAHSLWMFYLRNRAGFADKGETRESRTEVGQVTFVGEERI